MQRFLTGPLLQEAIRDVLNSESVRCAVAFWGRGAEKSFGPKISNVKIICNLNMGGTNPEPLKILRKDVRRFELRQCDTLHAKVYIGDQSAIVTSANNSTNGLGVEGTLTKGWIEAGVRVTEIDDLTLWFDTLWNNPSIVRSITEDDLNKEMPKGGPSIGFTRPKYVLIWSLDASKAGISAWVKAEKETGKALGFYEDFEVPAGADIFDFMVCVRSIQYKGCWQTFDPQLIRFKKGKGYITLCQRKRADPLRDELKGSDSWKSILHEIWKSNGDCVLRLNEPSLEGLIALSRTAKGEAA